MNDRTPRSRRRIAATILALVGVFSISSGFALASGAYATKPAPNHKVDVCHATSSDTNPYVFINVDIASTKFQGHLMHRNAPNKHWKSDGWWNGVWHTAGSPKADFIASYTYNGVSHDLDGDITPGFCGAPVTGPITVGAPSFTDPGCPPKPQEGSYTTPAHVALSVASGSTAPGDSITLHGVTDPGYEFADHSTAKDFSHAFPAIPDNCGGGTETPLDATATQHVEQPSCENDGVGSLSVTGDHISLSPDSPQTGGPGAHVSIVATALDGHLFADESSEKTFAVTFDSYDTNCGEPQLAAPVDPKFVDPTCDNQDGADVILPAETAVLSRKAAAASAAIIKQGTVDGVTYTVTGDLAPGGTVDVDATPAPGFVFTDPLPKTHWSHTFPAFVGAGTTPGEGEIVCGTIVEPPVVKPPATKPPATKPPAAPPPATPTIVESGLSSLPGSTGTVPAGLAPGLFGGGFALLLLAGWLVRSQPGRRARRAAS